ncbi:Aste57867_12329 [Aphanomyces stellatus]|uniref:Aste57867_12329 protein n=1 Tax=Aphanomyces stellatus TaxID=120398 RepID=A0A485KW27_9STRA|nr:hypothetical protein As57867_012283 [Aphanomyces stellatus]VFT89181.1 Aste57867_12329 [Aphanomyces stellatus]
MRAARQLGAIVAVVAASTASARECGSSDYAPILPLLTACEAVAPDTNVHGCAFAECRLFNSEAAKLPCTINGKNQSFNAHVCDNFTPLLFTQTSSRPPTPAPTLPPALQDYTSCLDEFISLRKPFAVKCQQVSNYTSFANITNTTILQDYCSHEMCVINAKQYATLDSCTVDGVLATTYGSLCDNMTLAKNKPPIQLNTSTTACSTETMAARAALKLKCQQASGFQYLQNITSLATLNEYCSHEICVANLQQYATLGCNINGALGQYTARICSDPTQTSPPPPAPACAVDVIAATTTLQTQCQQASGYASLANVTTQKALADYCSYPACEANLKQYTNWTCTINGAAAKYFATLCDPIATATPKTSAPAAPTPAPVVTIASLADECTDADVPVGFMTVQARCFAAAGIKLTPTSKIDLVGLCRYPECDSLFKLYGSWNCNIEGHPASNIAQTCVNVPRVVGNTTVAPTVASFGSAPKLSLPTVVLVAAVAMLRM